MTRRPSSRAGARGMAAAIVERLISEGAMATFADQLARMQRATAEIPPAELGRPTPTM